jgi:acetolactate synthase I/II/III large subunit
MNHFSVSDVIADYLLFQGIESVYVYPGGTIAPLINSLVSVGIRIEVFKHEQGALYAALAKARLTGKIQIAMVTSGPGVTNALTPLADAYYDSTPLLLITGQVGTGDLLSGRNVRQRGFQEVPTATLVSAICKRVVCPTTVDQALQALPELLITAVEGRPGPVVFDLPMDVQRADCDFGPLPHLVPSATGSNEVPCNLLEGVAQALSQARRPVIMFGQGAVAAGAFELYEHLAVRSNAFVVCSLPGLGAFPGGSERFLGYVGHTGHEAANRAVHETDFLLVLGARLDVRQTGTMVSEFVPNGKIAWVNNDPAELEFARVRIDWSIQGDAGQFVEALLNIMPETISEHDRQWQSILMQQHQADTEDSHSPSGGAAISPKEVLGIVDRHMRDSQGVVTTGVGSHQQWAARHLTYSPWGWSLLTSAGHGAMGYDLPTAVGAAMTYPDRTVLCVAGDGSFLMNIQELASLAERQLNVKILVLNNHRLGIVSQFQRITWGVDPASGDFATPDFVTIASGFGIAASCVTAHESLEEAINSFWLTKGPVLLEVYIDHDSDVVPMLLGGQTMDKMWQGY